MSYLSVLQGLGATAVWPLDDAVTSPQSFADQQGSLTLTPSGSFVGGAGSVVPALSRSAVNASGKAISASGLTVGSGDVWFCGWLKSSASAAAQVILANVPGFVLELQNTGKFLGGWSGNYITGATTLNDGNPHFWAFSRHAGVATLYLDGNATADATGTLPTAPGTSQFGVGNYVSGASYPFIGTLGGMAIGVGSYLTAVQAQAIYAAGLGSGTGLSAGTLSLTGVTTTTVNLSFGTTSGGTGTYSNQLQRSPHGANTFANLSGFSGATSTLGDNALSPATTYDYRVQVNDGSNTVYSNVLAVTTASTFSPIIQTPLKFGFIGDSITAGSALPFIGQDPPTQLGQLWGSLFGDRVMKITNRGAGGTATANWVSGSASLTGALAAFASAGMSAGDVVHVMLGTNDAAANVSAATYKSNLQSLIGAVLAAGYKIVLAYPILPDLSRVSPGLMTVASFNLLVDYQAQIDSLVGSGVCAGDKLAPGYFVNHPGEIGSDGIHPTTVGAVSHSRLMSIPIAKAIGLV